MEEFKEYEFMGYSDFKHDFAIEELARKHVGGGKPCGYFVSIGNGVIKENEENLVSFENSEEDISSKMIAYFKDQADAQKCADSIYIGQDSNIAWVRIEDEHGEMFWRFLTAVPSVNYIEHQAEGPWIVTTPLNLE